MALSKLLTTSVVATAFTPTLFASPIDRAMWVWEAETYRLLDNVGSYRNDTFDFLQRRGIDTLYLYADQYHQNGVDDYRPCDPAAGPCLPNRNSLTDSPDHYRELIALAHERGMSVYALLGSAFLDSWAWHRPEKQHHLTTAFQNVLSFNQSTTDAKQRFDGVNTDVEPWGDPDFTHHKVQHAKWYLNAHDDLIQIRNDAVDNGIPGSDIAVGPAMAFWTDTVEDVQWQGQTKPWNEHIQDLHDYVTVMNFRDTANGRNGNDGPPSTTLTPDGLISLARNEVQYATAIDQPFKIGVLTGPGNPQKITTLEEGAEWLERELSITSQAIQSISNNQFQGFAVQDLIDYQRLVNLHWTDSTDGSWNLPNHWGVFEHHKPFETRPSGNTPRELDGIYIRPTNGAAVQGPSTDQTVYWLSIGATETGTTNLQLQGNTFTVTQGVTIKNRGSISGNGTINADVDLHTGGRIFVDKGETITVTGALTGPGNIAGTGTLILQGSYSPGHGVNTITTDTNIQLGNEHNLIIDIAGFINGMYDKLIIHGDLALAGILSVNILDGYAPTPGDEFTILSINGTATGQFLGLDEQSTINSINGVNIHISYTGGDGNDVVLRVVPEPNTIALLTTALALVNNRRKLDPIPNHHTHTYLTQPPTTPNSFNA